MQKQRGACTNPESSLHRYASLIEADARSTARDIWGRINEPNLTQNIRPTHSRATAVLHKNSQHAVHSILLRKI